MMSKYIIFLFALYFSLNKIEYSSFIVIRLHENIFNICVCVCVCVLETKIAEKTFTSKYRIRFLKYVFLVSYGSDILNTVLFVTVPNPGPYPDWKFFVMFFIRGFQLEARGPHTASCRFSCGPLVNLKTTDHFSNYEKKKNYTLLPIFSIFY